MLVVKPSYIYSTDDTTMYACVGAGITKESFLLVRSNALYSNFRYFFQVPSGDSNAMQEGLCVKLWARVRVKNPRKSVDG